MPKRSFPPPQFSKRILIVVGAFGSGKSEVSVNLARYLAESGSSVAIADLDIVNPYFRSREAAKELDKMGVRSLIPPGDLAGADLPVIIPEIKGAIQRSDGVLILDVGGDDLGATVLRSLEGAFKGTSYEMLLVLNANRPFTATPDGALKALKEIESASRLNMTGIVSNTHLIDDTTSEEVRKGIALSEEVSRVSGLPLVFVCAIESAFEGMKKIDYPVLTIHRSLLKPWERHSPMR